VITVDRVGPVAVVQIQPFSDVALKIVKSVKPRSWDEVHLCWEVPSTAVNHLARRLHEAGQAVVVDGVAYDPLRAAEEKNPFVPLMAALPERLRDKVFAALVGVFSLDAGDEEAALFAWLCDAVSITDKEAKASAQALQKLLPRPKPATVERTGAQTKPVRRLVRKAS
jgi:hypothetical protein